VPKAVRDALGARPGDEIELEADGLAVISLDAGLDAVDGVRRISA
jgi:bifunctional DNA-binding transcriptional regulator/antitoxin component of YhaV-PrlF toxin-antitoxin module